MKTNSFILLLILLTIFLTGCTTLKRYNSLMPSGTDNTLADIDLFGFRLSQAKQVGSSNTLWNLSADAQSQFIKILNSRYPDNEKFKEALSFNYLKGDEELQPNDYVRKDLRLIFSVSKNRDFIKSGLLKGLQLSPADRIEYLKISLEVPNNSPIRFTGWNMYTTEYGSVDISDVSFSRSIELDASASFAAEKGGLGGESSAGGKSSLNKREDQVLKYRFLKLNGRINDKIIEMEEEGTREIDLTGNIIADVSLEFDQFPEVLSVFSGLSDSTGKLNDPDKLKVQYTEVVVPLMADIKDTIYADLTINYVYRNVGHGRRTFPEWDDRVKYYSGIVRKTVPLFTIRDYVPDFYCIGTNKIVKEMLKIQTADNKSYELKFRSYEEAYNFWEWLMHYLSKNENEENAVKIGGQTLLFRGKDLTYRQIRGEPGFMVIPCYY